MTDPRPVAAVLRTLRLILAAVCIIGTVAIGGTLAVGYWGRAAIVTGQRQACREDIADRRSDIIVRATQAWATQQVASDPRQPARTRSARSWEAREDRASVRDRLTRVDERAARTALRRVAPAVRPLLLRLDRSRGRPLRRGRLLRASPGPLLRLDCAAKYPGASLIP